MRALILTADGMEDSEFFYPYYRLQELDIAVDVAAPESGRITGKHGYEFSANISIAQARPENYDILIIPGGKAPEAVRLVPEALLLTQTMMQSNKPVGVICHGAQVLISAGVIRGRKATCWIGIRDDLKAAGANYVDREVVVDGNLVTSRCPADLPAFCRELVNLLEDNDSGA